MAESVSPERAPFRWRWALPLIPIAASMFCLSALVYYHTAMGGRGEAWGFFQGFVVGMYRWLGFVPTFMFWLLLFVWCSIWFVTGSWDRVRTRLLWMVAFTLSLAILVNLGTPADAPPPHAGLIGTYIAVRLSSVIGYAFSALLAVGASLAALLLATDFLFYRYFESLARGHVTEDLGVEPEATDAFRELAFSGVYADEPRPAPLDAVAVEPEVAEAEADAFGQDLARAVDSDIIVRPRRRYARPIEELAADRLGESMAPVVPLDPISAAEPEPVVADLDGAQRDSEVDFREVAADTNSIETSEVRPDEFDLAPLSSPGPVMRPYVRASEEVGVDDRIDIGGDDVAMTEPVVSIPRGRRARRETLFEANSSEPEVASQLDAAAREVLAAGRASVTLLRRSLQCSPTEALSLLDQLRQLGVIDGESGSPYGRVLTTLADWEAR
jgi:hypothetical protein